MWWQPFATMAGLNLLSGQSLDQSLLNAGVNTATGQVLGNIAPDFGTNMGNFGSVQNATNVPSMLQTGANVATQPVSTSMMQTLAQNQAPSTSMMQTLANRGQDVAQNLGQQMTPAYKNINPALVADASKIPAEQMYVDTLASKYRPQFEAPSLGQSAEYTGGGYSPSVMGRIGEGIEKGIEFAKENPLLTGFGALAAYRGINPPERPVPPPSAPGISRGGAVALGQPLKVRRPR